MKTLSVVIPAFNMDRYLVPCLSSLIGDESIRDELDIIVVNDGSTDQTLSLATDFVRKFEGVTSVINKKNGHYGSCINAGLKQTRGKYVRILDADDTFDAQELRRFVHFLRTCDADLVLSDYVKVDESDQILTKRSCADYRTACVSDLLSARNPLQLPAITYRTQLLRDIGYCQTEGVAYSDTEWCIYPMVAVRTIANSGCCVYRYRMGRAGQSVGQYYRRMEDLGRVLDSLLMNVTKYKQYACTEENKSYLVSRVAEHVRFVAEILIANCPAPELKERYRNLCEIVEDNVEIADAFYRHCMLRKLGGVRLFALMRKHFDAALPIVLVYRLRLRIGGGR